MTSTGGWRLSCKKKTGKTLPELITLTKISAYNLESKKEICLLWGIKVNQLDDIMAVHICCCEASLIRESKWRKTSTSANDLSKRFVKPVCRRGETNDTTSWGQALIILTKRLLSSYAIEISVSHERWWTTTLPLHTFLYMRNSCSIWSGLAKQNVESYFILLIITDKRRPRYSFSLVSRSSCFMRADST